MDGFLRILKLELRRGSGWILAFALVLVSPLVRDFSLLTGGDQVTWFRLTYVAGSSVLMCPLIAGFGAWLAVRSHRRQLAELLAGSDRFGLGHVAVDLAALFCWVSFAAIAITAAALLVIQSRGPWGLPPFAILPSFLLALLASGALGYLIGYGVPRIYSPPAAALVTYAFFLFLGSLSEHGDLFAALLPTEATAAIFSAPWFEPRLDVALWSSLWYVGLGLAALTMIALFRRRDRVSLVFAAAAVAFAIFGARGTLTSAANAAGEPPTPVPAAPVCAKDAAITVCVHPAFAASLNVDSSTLAAVVQPITGLPGIPTTFAGDLIEPSSVSQDALPYPQGDSEFVAVGTALRLVAPTQERQLQKLCQVNRRSMPLGRLRW